MCVWEILCRDWDKGGGVKQKWQSKRRNTRERLLDRLPVVPFPQAACLWRPRRCRRPRQTWACCHWHQWPGCWQLLGYSAGRRPLPPSVNTRKRNTHCSFRNWRQVNKVRLLKWIRESWFFYSGSFLQDCFALIWQWVKLHLVSTSAIESLTLSLCLCWFFIPFDWKCLL